MPERTETSVILSVIITIFILTDVLSEHLPLIIAVIPTGVFPVIVILRLFKAAVQAMIVLSRDA